MALLTAEDVWHDIALDSALQGPTVGVSVSLNFPGLTPKLREEMKALISNTLEALVAIGIYPVLLDATANPLPAYDRHRIQGVIVLGGGDIHPEIAGHPPEVPNSFGADARADLHTMALIRHFTEESAPVLGICRGSQLLNLAFGGSIIADVGAGTTHRSAADTPSFARELVTLKRGSRLQRICGAEQMLVEAAHHQAVDHVSEAFLAAAWASDGVVEAIEHREDAWVVGVQWHPEASSADRKVFLRMLENFKSSIDAGKIP